MLNDKGILITGGTGSFGHTFVRMTLAKTQRASTGQAVHPDLTYSSDNNPEWMSIETLSTWIAQNSNKIGKI